MNKLAKKHDNLDYLQLPPKTLNWKVIAGPIEAELSKHQSYDLIFDKKDLKIRKMDTKDNLDRFDEIDRLRKERGL
jgi:hypothetical protein